MNSGIIRRCDGRASGWTYGRIYERTQSQRLLQPEGFYYPVRYVWRAATLACGFDLDGSIDVHPVAGAKFTGLFQRPAFTGEISKIQPPASAKFSENRGHFYLASGHRNPLSRSFVPLASRLRHRASRKYRFVTSVRRSNRSKGNDGRAHIFVGHELLGKYVVANFHVYFARCRRLPCLNAMDSQRFVVEFAVRVAKTRGTKCTTTSILVKRRMCDRRDVELGRNDCFISEFYRWLGSV